MDAQETLNTLAEVAVALAGFAGIMFGLRSRSAGPTQEITRLAMTLWICTSVVFCAILPTALSQFTDEEAIIWGLPCFILGILQFSNMTAVTFFLRKGTVAPAFPKLNIITMGMIYISSIAMMSASVDALVPRSSGTLIIGCLCGVLMGAYSFISNSTWALRGGAGDA